MSSEPVTRPAARCRPRGAELRAPFDDGTVTFLLRRAATARPMALCIDGGGDAAAGPSLTYEQLRAYAEQLAWRLVDAGVTPGDRVVIDADTPAECIVGMQAALMAGAAYVPLPGKVPTERVNQIARDSRAAVSIGPQRSNLCLPALPPLPANSGPADIRGPFEPAPRRADDLAYILYTSGSRGAPKGVCITHRNARAFIDWAAEEFGAGSRDRFANHAAFSFDLSVLDVYVAIAVGACIVPVPYADRQSPSRLAEFFCSRQITVWYSVPSALDLMFRHGGLDSMKRPDSLRCVLFAGEAYPLERLRLLREWVGPAVDMANLYGPTETNVVAFHRVTDADFSTGLPLPIGSPASDAELALVPPGDEPEVSVTTDEVGELLVSGPTVSPGYWGDPSRSGAYRTGDLVRIRPDGTLEFHGRSDDLLKIRGHRVEPAEIEAALCSVPDVTGACAVSVSTSEGATLAVAFETEPGATIRSLGVREALSRMLPSYMLPDDVVRLDRIPRTERGKIDRESVEEKLAARAKG